MKQYNCYLMGGPKDGVTFVTERPMDVFRFNAEPDGAIGRVADPQAKPVLSDYIPLRGIGMTSEHAVYVPSDFGHNGAKILLHAAANRHYERTLLHECLGMMVNPNTKPYSQEWADLVRKIQEHLK